jgi:hypothetical protein
MRPVFVCCTPHTADGPSGFVWLHSSKCPEFPNVKARLHLISDELKSIEDHPATADSLLVGALRVYRRHPAKCICAACVMVTRWEYMGAHMDDEDDQRNVEAEA